MPHPIAYDNHLGYIVDNLAPTTEGDPIGILGSLVASAGVAIGPEVRTQIVDGQHPLLAWFLLCGPTAAGRKGTAGEAAARVMARADPVLCANHVVSGLSSAEGLIATVADDEDDDEAEPKSPLEKRLLVIENEYAVVLSRAKREGNALSGVLREAWDGRDLRVMTKNPLVAREPHIGLVGHISPQELADRMSMRDLNGGTYNRFLLLYVERAQKLPEGGGADPDLVATLGDDLGERLDRARGLRNIRRKPDTKAAWSDLYDEFIALEDDERLGPWVSRAVPYTLRLAAIYSALQGEEMIGTHELASAAGLVRYGLDSVRYVLNADSKHSDVEHLAKLIRDAGPEGINKSEITHRFSGRANVKVLDELLDQVVALDGYESTKMPSSGGRPATKYRYFSG